MRISTKGRYGLKAMFYLGENSDKILSLKQLSSLTEVKPAYLEKLLGILKRHNLIEAERGSMGGYKLNKNAKDITINEILVALEGDLGIANCNVGKCDSKNCPNRQIFNLIYEEINQVLSNITLLEMIEGRKI